MNNRIAKWRKSPETFFTEVLRLPETGEPFELYPEQIIFLRHALTLKKDGRLPYPELLFSAPKKSGKTTFAAGCLLYTIIVLGGRYAEGYCLANDLEQSQGRVFQATKRIVEASPLLNEAAQITANKITFTATGSTITALASDFAGAAGANPTISVFDEIWGYSSDSAHRLWDEMVPPPTRKVTCRFTVSYAGFEGESKLLEDLVKRGKAGKEIAPDLYKTEGDILAYVTHNLKAPWQTEQWQDQMRKQLRPGAFIRMIQNQFVTSESEFVPIEWWDRIATSTPIAADSNLPVVIGVDAALKRDDAAIAVVTWIEGKARLVGHKIFHPQKGETLDLEDTLEESLHDYRKRFAVRAVYYDPWQFARSAQALQKSGIHMKEYPQSLPNLTAMTQNLYELLKGQNLVTYSDDEIRLAMQRAVAVETSRGLKITKEKASHKIDIVVAIAMAALGAMELRIEPINPDLEPMKIMTASDAVDGFNERLGFEHENNFDNIDSVFDVNEF